jgi:hypothetical protein
MLTSLIIHNGTFMEGIMSQSMITSSHKQHCNNSTKPVQKWNNSEFEVNSIYRHWKMSNGRWMTVFVSFLEYFYFSDFNDSLKELVVAESKSKHLLFHISVNSFNRVRFARELFSRQENNKSLWELKFF